MTEENPTPALVEHSKNGDRAAFDRSFSDSSDSRPDPRRSLRASVAELPIHEENTFPAPVDQALERPYQSIEFDSVVASGSGPLPFLPT